MQYKVEQIKDLKEGYYDRLVIYFDDKSKEYFSTNTIETINVEKHEGKKRIHVGDFHSGLWNVYEDGMYDHWFYKGQTIYDKKAIGFDIE